MGKANGLPSIIPLEKVVPAVTEAHLLRADEVRKLGSSTQSLHHSVELAKLGKVLRRPPVPTLLTESHASGPHFQLEAAIYLLSAVRFSAVPSAVFDAFAKTAEDDPHLLPIFQVRHDVPLR